MQGKIGFNPTSAEVKGSWRDLHFLCLPLIADVGKGRLNSPCSTSIVIVLYVCVHR